MIEGIDQQVHIGLGLPFST